MNPMETQGTHRVHGFTMDPLENEVDRQVTTWVSTLWHQSLIWDAFMVVVGQWTPVVMLVVIVTASITSSEWHTAAVSGILAVISAVLARAINEPISRLINRPRPFELTGFQPLLHHEKGQAFPSNHATGAFALAISMIDVPGFAAILIGLATLLCVSRIYNGLHHATDVCAGALHGSLIAVIVHVLEYN